MNEDYISGYLECVSRIKSIYTPYLGGHNEFFGVNRSDGNGLKEDLVAYIYECNSRTPSFYRKEEINEKIELVEIKNWSIELIPMIEEWTCDKLIEKENGKNGDYLSEHLVTLLTDFLPYNSTKLYKMKSRIKLPWGDNSGEEYLFETEDKFYILTFGECS